MKRQKLGAHDRCFNCPHQDIEALIPVPISKLPTWFVEKHHLARRAASDFTIPLCRNCHALLTDWQEDWDPPLRNPRTPVERLAALLKSIADWLRALAAKMVELAGLLEAWVAWLLRGMQGEAPA